MNWDGSKFSTPIFVFQVVTATAGMSIGASGALFTILGIYGTLMPESEWSIILLPMYSFTAENGIKGKFTLGLLDVILTLDIDTIFP